MSMHNEAGAGARTRSRRGTCGGMGSLASFWADLGPLYEITLVRRSSARASDASMGPAGPDTTHHRPVTPAAAVRGAAIGKLGVQGYGRGGGGCNRPRALAAASTRSLVACLWSGMFWGAWCISHLPPTRA